MCSGASQFWRKSWGALRPDVVQSLGTASTLVREVLGTAGAVSKTCTHLTNRSSFDTLFSVFRDEFNELCNFLESRSCHHVRCLRPNDIQAPLVFKVGEKFQHDRQLAYCSRSVSSASLASLRIDGIAGAPAREFRGVTVFEARRVERGSSVSGATVALTIAQLLGIFGLVRWS